MHTRPATQTDVPALAELQRGWETAWLGASKESEDEVRESFNHAEASRVLLDNGRIVAAAWCAGTESSMIVDPDVPAEPLYADLLAWFATRPGTSVEALSQDTQLRAALVEHGWQHVRSAFDLIRRITPDWVLAEPAWPSGIVARHFGADDADAVHQLIYVDAAWSAVPGHHERPFDEWYGIFVTDGTVPEQQVLAWRGDRLVGIAMGRTFSDGTGWVSQLAVARDERGHGLGRALLLDAFRRRREGGATALGLSVSQANRHAIDLYLGVGLAIDREWMEYSRG